MPEALATSGSDHDLEEGAEAKSYDVVDHLIIKLALSDKKAK